MRSNEYVSQRKHPGIILKLQVIKCVYYYRYTAAIIVEIQVHVFSAVVEWFTLQSGISMLRDLGYHYFETQ